MLRRIGRPWLGLSPRVRGKPLVPAIYRAADGPIPASAGETWRKPTGFWLKRAYPRECGGNADGKMALEVEQGLSPRVRGKHVAARHGPIAPGPIPASAGETSSFVSRILTGWAYPRECGGNQRLASVCRAQWGLSPRVRGKPRAGRGAGPAGGPIPASAGETEIVRLIKQFQRAYPRECGGNPTGWHSATDRWGLSPRVRGKPARDYPECTRGGPIPASAGETSHRAASATIRRAYPRECGGNEHSDPYRFLPQGLSPRVRGKPQGKLTNPLRRGPIPASAGETEGC